MQSLRGKLVAVMLVLSMVAILSGCAKNATSSTTSSNSASSSSTSAKPFKIALLMTGPADDGGWNSAAMAGLAKIKADADLGAQTSYTDNIAQSDQAQTMRDYANRGYNLIIGHGFQFDDALKQVAAEYPNVDFVGINGHSTGPNLAVFKPLAGEMGYLLGVLCGNVSKTHKIGIITASPDPSVIMDFGNLKTEAQSINHQTTVIIDYTGSWTDIAKAKEAALAQIADGADIIVADDDVCNKGVFQACVEKNVQSVGWSVDQHDLAPNNILTSDLQDMGQLVYLAGKYAKDGTLKGQIYALGIKDGVQGLGTFDQAVPTDLQNKLMQMQKDIANGKIKPNTTT